MFTSKVVWAMEEFGVLPELSDPMVGVAKENQSFYHVKMQRGGIA